MKFSMIFIAIIFAIFELTGTSYATDIYEPDDSHINAGKIIVGGGNWQEHSLHYDSDEDWIKFLGLPNEKESKPTQYAIEIKNSQCTADITLKLFKESSIDVPFFVKDNISPGEIDSIDLTCIKPTLYFIRVSITNQCCAYCAYGLKVYRPYGDHDATLYGKATRSGEDNKPASNIKVTTNIGCGDITDDEGNFIFLLPPESFVLKVNNPNFIEYQTLNEALEAGSAIENNISLIPINLGEGVLPILKILTGNNQLNAIDKNSDINGDGKIGLEEAIFILRNVAQ